MSSKKTVTDRAVYETATDELEHRLKLDGQSIILPSYARVTVETVMSATGTVTIRIPVKEVQIIPADKRLSPKRQRQRNRSPKPTAQELLSGPGVSDGD